MKNYIVLRVLLAVAGAYLVVVGINAEQAK